MSHGALSKEAHETLAISMNRIKGASCSGEGGEDKSRFKILDNGDTANSRVKQIASARFGVTIDYLNNCNELIKSHKEQNQEKEDSFQVLKLLMKLQNFDTQHQVLH